MKLVRITDGLGNQMFQYAFAKAVQKLTGDTVLLDLSWFPEYGGKLRTAEPRPYGLSAFPISLQACQNSALLKRIIHGSGISGLLNQCFHRKPGIVREGRHSLSLDNLRDYHGDILFRGFFQQCDYSDFVRDELLADFSIPEESLNQANQDMLAQIRAAGTAATMVHVRRGDYLKAATRAVHGICAADYYAKAEAALSAACGHPLHLFIFSDDPEWVKQNYRSDYPITCVAINSAAEGHLDINLMRHCHHAITANSTFSWWGAWLIQNPGATIACPSAWFADGRNTSGLCPNNWLAL